MLDPLLSLEHNIHQRCAIPSLDFLQRLFHWNEVEAVKNINLLSGIVMFCTGIFGIHLSGYGDSVFLDTMTITALAIGIILCLHHIVLAKELDRMSRFLKHGYGLNASATRQFQIATFAIMRPLVTWLLPLGAIFFTTSVSAATRGEVGELIMIGFVLYQIVMTFLVHAWSRLEGL